MNVKTTLVTLIFLILIIPTAHGFGYTQSKTSVYASPGDDVHFKIFLFRNPGENVEKITLTPHTPKTWILSLEREIDFTQEGSSVYIQTGDKKVKARSVDVGIKIPINEAHGLYKIKIIAASSNANTKGVAIAQEADFNLAVRIGEKGAAPIGAGVEWDASTEERASGADVTGSLIELAKTFSPSLIIIIILAVVILFLITRFRKDPYQKYYKV
jgi:hypothetical protein